MEGENQHDRSLLHIDLVDSLIGRDASSSDPVGVDDVLNWFGADDQETAAELIEELVDRDAPFDSDGDNIWFTDRDEAADYLDTIETDPPWYSS